MQQRAAEDLRSAVVSGLQDSGFEVSGAHCYVTPRRLALVIDDVPAQSPASCEERKGPRIDAPAKAIEGFLKAAGVTLDACDIASGKKGEYYLARIEKPGVPAGEVIAALIPDVIRKFPWPKSMRWGTGKLRWVRPLHSILCVYDGQPIPFSIEGIKAGNTTCGHRFMAPDTITVSAFADYRSKLQDQFVMLDFQERADFITAEAEKLARSKRLQLIRDDALVREVAGLVEWPVVLAGEFDKGYLSVPPEAVITSIRSHQKCFCLKKKSGPLANHYLLVSNLIARDGGRKIVAGNNRVISARLSDAKFFWDSDRKIKLKDRLPALKKVTFHARLGNQMERAGRLEKLAGKIAAHIEADKENTELAARLAKADLVTGMVGEFPELQGIMGCYYAREEGLDEDIATAIRDHYKPLGPADTVPAGKVAKAVALADKIDMLTGFWAIDEKPTGSKDPYALRRAALGVIRILIEDGLRLPLKVMFEAGFKLHQHNHDEGFADSFSSQELLTFFAGRLKVYLRDHGARHDLIDAVFALGDQDDLCMIVKRVEALAQFLKTDDGQNLLAGVRRAVNILRIEEKKDGVTFTGNPLQNLLVLGEEKDLHRAITAANARTINAIKAEDFTAAMHAIAALRGPVDAFFDKVTVNADDPNFRENRLKLLNRIREVTATVADFSKIEG